MKNIKEVIDNIIIANVAKGFVHISIFFYTQVLFILQILPITFVGGKMETAHSCFLKAPNSHPPILVKFNW